MHRQKDIQYSSRVSTHIARQLQSHRLRHVIKELLAYVPEEERNSEAVRELAGWGCLTRMHVVRMLGDERGYRFEPANLTVQQGDSVRFVMVSGGPHNIAFDSTSIPTGAKAKLSANMHSQIADLMGPLMLNADESYTLSFAGLPAGTYAYQCVPHLAMNQRGVITVR